MKIHEVSVLLSFGSVPLSACESCSVWYFDGPCTTEAFGEFNVYMCADASECGVLRRCHVSELCIG